MDTASHSSVGGTSGAVGCNVGDTLVGTSVGDVVGAMLGDTLDGALLGVDV